jgi:hypothetical protein
MEDLKQQIEAMECPVHKRHPVVKIEQRTDFIEVKVNICEDFKSEVSNFVRSKGGGVNYVTFNDFGNM